MRRVGYTSPSVPPEWIAAHGFRPVRLLPGAEASAAGAAAEGLCPFAAATLRELEGAPPPEAVVFATTCDQMRRAAEWVRPGLPLFLLNAPATWGTPVARGLLASELRRLGRFLVGQGGRAPDADALRAALRRGEAARAALRRDLASLPAPACAARLLAWLEGDAPPPPAQAPAARPPGIPVALLGGSLARPDFALYGELDRAGLRVAADASETGPESQPERFDPARLAADPFDAMVEAYAGPLPAPQRRPNAPLFEWLDRAVAGRGVRGVVVARHAWCDLWAAEVPRLRERAGRPVLELDPGEGPGDAPRRRSRIEAFAETLR